MMLNHKLVSLSIQFLSFRFGYIDDTATKADLNSLSIWGDHKLKHIVFIVSKFWVNYLVINFLSIMAMDCHIKLTIL